MSYVNPMRKLLKENKYVLGTHTGMCEPGITELLGKLYDFVWIDMEHSSLDKRDIYYHILAAKAAGTASLVRVAWNDPVLAKPVLDMGPDAIVFPQVNTAAQARAAVEACSYPQYGGVRGWGPMRANDYGLMDTDKFIAESGNFDRVFIIIQVESCVALEELEEIVKIPGIGAICVGPADTSASMGKLTKMRDPEVMKVYDKMGEIISKSDVPMMVSIGFCEPDISEWKARGVRIFGINTDLGMIVRGAKSDLEYLNPLFGRKDKYYTED